MFKKISVAVICLFILAGCDDPLPEGKEYVPEDNYLFAQTYDRIVKSCTTFVKNDIKNYACASGEVIQEVPWKYREYNDNATVKIDKDGFVNGVSIKYWSPEGIEMYQMFANPNEQRDIRDIYKQGKYNPALKIDISER